MAVRTVKTLWVGELDASADEATLYKYFEDNRKEILSAKVMRDKNQLGGMAGYGFVEFRTHEIAAQIMETHTGKPIAGYPGKVYRLNWAQSKGTDNPAMRALNTAPQISVFVGDVPAEATDQMLDKMFRDEYGDSVINAQVVVDLVTGRSKGYGFVRFTDDPTAQRAIVEMQGKYLLNRRMRLSGGAKKNVFTGSSEANFDGTTVYIGNLAVTSEEELKSYFRGFGDITRVKIIDGKNCAFVDFVSRASAETAISQMNGAIIGGMKIRMSWGHSGSAGGLPPPKSKTIDRDVYERGAFVQANELAEQQRIWEHQQKAMQFQQWHFYNQLMSQSQSQAQLPEETLSSSPGPQSESELRYAAIRLKQFTTPFMARHLTESALWV